MEKNFFTGTYVAFVVFHYGARLAYGPYRFWILDAFILIVLMADLFRLTRAISSLTDLKLLSHRKSFRYGLLLHAAVGVISGCLMGYAQR